MPKVSIIISSYNHARFIGLAIESVLNQSFQDFEILIADDASSDGTKEVISNYLHDPRIKFFSFEKNREEHMKNFCLTKATGKYIAILNSDDVFHTSKLEKQVEFLESNPSVGASFTLVDWINENGEPISGREGIFSTDNKTRFEWLRNFFIIGNSLCHSSAVIRKDIIDHVGNYNRWFAQLSDFDLWIRICLVTEIHIYPTLLTYNRLLNNEINASGNRPEVFNSSYFEHVQVLEHYSSPLALQILPQVFPELNELANADLLKRKGLLSLTAISSANVACRNYGLTTYYSIIANSNKSTLAEIFGDNYAVDFYKNTSKTSIITIPSPVIKTEWSLNDEIIASSSIIVGYGNEEIRIFTIPPIKALLTYTISFHNSPNLVVLSEFIVQDSKGFFLQNELPKMAIQGNCFTSFEHEIFEILCFDTSISITGSINTAELDDSYALKIKSTCIQNLSRSTISSIVEKELQTQLPLLLKNQNFEDISAKRLLSSFVKKLFRRIKVLT